MRVVLKTNLTLKSILGLTDIILKSLTRDN